MQAAVDRVIRTFRARLPASFHDPMSDEQTQAVRDEATDFAAQLLENYRGQLARRTLKLD